jgi:phage terminase small subunit
MGSLHNLRWERFAQEYAAGQSLEASYRRAGFEQPMKYARFNAAALRDKPFVKARIVELMAERAEVPEITATVGRPRICSTQSVSCWRL